jgi:hypothetical protein
MHRRTHRTRIALLTVTATGLLAAPAALAAPVDGGDRNPSNNASQGYNAETQIIGEIAQNQGGHAAGTGGYVTRQSNKSDSGGGAIYGCRSKAGTEACVAANNLNSGDAFRFQVTPTSATIGQLRFGLDINKTFDKAPFVTNGTGLVKNLNADRVDGKSAEDFVEKGSLLFAAIGANGAVGNNRGIAAGTTAVAADDTGDDQAFTVPFAGDVRKCVATATLAGAPTAAVTDPDDVPVLTVANSPTNPAAFVVNEVNAGDTAYPFSIQVTC